MKRTLTIDEEIYIQLVEIKLFLMKREHKLGITFNDVLHYLIQNMEVN